MEQLNSALSAVKKKVQTRDNLLLDFDKYKTLVIKLTAKPAKDQLKLTDVIDLMLEKDSVVSP